MSSGNSFPIVGIGASAGGVAALEAFFKGLPNTDGQMAFVIVTHLNPERESLLHEVLARYTELPVLVATDGLIVEPGNVYVLPQNAVLTIEKGRLQLRRPDPLHRERKPIDIFFASLAVDQGENAVGIVMSGGDADGTLGIKAIKAHGGLTLAQSRDGSGPRNPDMPRSAIASGLVDLALPAEEMGAKLSEVLDGNGILGERPDGKSAAKALQNAQEEIYAVLRRHTAHDFSGYKTKTFLRRINRRMQVLQINTIDAYLARLRREPPEVMNLFRDLLINVTSFFRDAEAFEALRTQVLPKLFEGRGADETIRVWVPGCSTGEEVYSIAILMREEMERHDVSPNVHIFATDIDEPALAAARSARYPEALLEGVSEERCRRFFILDGGSYVLSKDVREMCIFSPHSVIRDPPFSRMDLISCRNLLIYFGPDIQNQVIPTFHYALRPGGYLFLGSSESIGQHGELFATVVKKYRIFQSRGHASAPPRFPITLESGRTIPFSREARGRGNHSGAYPLRQAVETHILEHFSPPHVVVNGEGDIVYYSPRTGRFLEAAQGAPTRQLLTLARRGVRIDLRHALRQAIETQQAVIKEGLEVEEDGERIQRLSLTVEPLPRRDGQEALYVVLFNAIGPAQTRSEVAESGRDSADTTVADLERELRDTREKLQSTIEEYETALEELKSSNEELVSVNEESQSTNEELEASKEEMQSLNEELNTINAELSGKVEELDRANNDLKNLFESTQVATVFLDRNLVIRNFTPAASTFFNLRPADVGRPLTDLSSPLEYPELKAQIAEVFKTSDTIEHRIAHPSDDRHYLVRLIPYRNGDNRIEGVVVTFVDVTILTQAEEHQKVLIQELNHRVKNMLAVVVSITQQTLADVPGIERQREVLVGRFNAMARAYSLLSQERWKRTSLTKLVRQETEPFGGDRVVVSGPDVLVEPREGISIAMAVHELVTNAAKHGALSNGTGRIEISWTVSEDGRVKLQWKECDGPRIDRPEEPGFGLRLVRGQIDYQLGGDVAMEFEPDGLLVKISFDVNGRPGQERQPPSS